MSGGTTPLWRTAVTLLGPALAAALAAAAAGAWRQGAPQRWWAAGYHRLLLDAAWWRFDTWLPAITALALVVTLAVRRLRPGAPARAWPVVLGGTLLALTAGLRGLGMLDARRVSAGPNLVLISIDTLRADRLGAYGHALPTSPVLDRRLAAAGVTFETVWSQSPKTTPSHMTMLTSLYPSVHGVELWDGTAPAHALRPAAHTLAEVLRNAGYQTAAFTGGAHMEGGWGFDQGFQVYEPANGKELGQARRWLRRHARRKFFLFFHTYQVHDPYLPPLGTVALFDPDYRGPVRDIVRRLRNDPTTWEEAHRLFWASVDRHDPRAVRYVSSLYDAGIRHMDAQTLAPLLDHLASLGVERDTLVVLTSDHGEAFLEHGIFLHDDLHAETLRVPLVLRFPGRLPAGRRVKEPVRLVDLVPTVLELLGVPAPPEAQGRSLAALARGDGAGGAGAEAVSEYSSPARGRVFESLREDGLAFITRDGAEALYDDPGERENVAATRSESVAALRARLGRWREACRALAAQLGPRGAEVVPQDESLRRLRALGYVQ